METSGKTRLLCLLGHPVAHSKSPAMHNTSCEKLGLDYKYLAFDVDSDNVGDVVKGLRIMNCAGFNLTMPLKESVIPYLDGLSDAARLANSVNTVVNENGKFIGYTTDGIGYLDSVHDAGVDTTDFTMTLLGAGGAASSIMVAAALHGFKEIRVFKRKNQTFDKTVSFCANIEKETGCKFTVIDFADEEALKNSIATSNLLTNATNVGMGDDKSTPVKKEYLHKDLIVSEIIYNPPVTTLMADAMDVGCKVVSGKYMLLFQGAAGFKKWTGCDMPIDYIKEKVFSD